MGFWKRFLCLFFHPCIGLYARAPPPPPPHTHTHTYIHTTPVLIWNVSVWNNIVRMLCIYGPPRINNTPIKITFAGIQWWHSLITLITSEPEVSMPPSWCAMFTPTSWRHVEHLLRHWTLNVAVVRATKWGPPQGKQTCGANFLRGQADQCGCVPPGGHGVCNATISDHYIKGCKLFLTFVTVNVHYFFSIYFYFLFPKFSFCFIKERDIFLTFGIVILTFFFFHLFLIY